MNNQEKNRMKRLSGLISESYEGEFIYESKSIEEKENLDEGFAGLANIFSRGSSALGAAAGSMAQSAANKITQAGQKVGQAVDKGVNKATEWYKEGEISAVKKKTENLRNTFMNLKVEFEKLTGKKLTGNMLQQINQILSYTKE